MKNLYTLIVLIACTVSCASIPSDHQSIVGEWTGTDSQGESALLVFNKDKSAEAIFEKESFSSATLAGGSVKWSLDTRYDPMHLDIILRAGTQEIGRLQMIARFVDSQTLEIRISRDMNTRPENFLEADGVNQIILTRQ